MKFRCKDCGRVYEGYRPEFCECGNDSFVKILSKAEKELRDDGYVEKEEKENPIFIILFLLVAAAVVWFVLSKVHVVRQAPELNDEYLTSVRQEMLKDFDPSGITRSGYCIISFEINEEGWINKRQFVQKASVDEINVKVYDMLKNATIVPKPPLDYTNKPIKIEFGCEANQEEVSCYSKNIVEKNVNNQ